MERNRAREKNRPHSGHLIDTHTRSIIIERRASRVLYVPRHGVHIIFYSDAIHITHKLCTQHVYTFIYIFYEKDRFHLFT